MSTKHTKGPWSFIKYSDFKGLTIESGAIDGENKIIATVADAAGWSDTEGKTHRVTLPTEANARLIAAAPELLEALHMAYSQIIAFLNEGDFKREVIFDAGYIVDAIAKAEGGEP